MSSRYTVEAPRPFGCRRVGTVKTDATPPRDMDGQRLAPTVGIVASILVVVVLVAPFAALESTTIANSYYALGALNPYVVGLFALVTLIVCAAGREERTDPQTAAGVALAFGVFAAIAALLWAVTVDVEVLFSLTTVAELEYHRWVLTALAFALPASAAWYARALRLF